MRCLGVASLMAGGLQPTSNRANSFDTTRQDFGLGAVTWFHIVILWTTIAAVRLWNHDNRRVFLLRSRFRIAFLIVSSAGVPPLATCSTRATSDRRMSTSAIRK